MGNRDREGWQWRTMDRATGSALINNKRTIKDKTMNANLINEGWVSVNERLPKVGQNVLLYTGMKPTDDFMIGHINEHGWFWDEESNYMSVPVTHWMPLPSPPSVGGN